MSKKLVFSEMFYSIQGEGPTMGRPSLFLRLAGCNLRCLGFSENGCDTYYSVDSRRFKDSWITQDIDELINSSELFNRDIPDLVITGGEPLLQQKSLAVLIEKVKDRFRGVYIETNGTVYPEDTIFRDVVLSISPKLYNSGEKDSIKLDCLEKLLNLNSDNYLKFVIRNEKDIIEAEDRVIKPLKVDKSRVWFMFMSTSREDLQKYDPRIIDFILDRQYSYSDRLHLRLGLA